MAGHSVQRRPVPFAEWSLPRKGENIRGYLLYWRETVPPMEGDAVHMMDQPYLHRQMKWRYPYATALDQRDIPYATQDLRRDYSACISRRTAPSARTLNPLNWAPSPSAALPRRGKIPGAWHRGFFQTDVISQQD